MASPAAQADNAELDKWIAKWDQWKDHLAPLVIDRGDNLAYTEATDTINPEQTAFARQMGRGVYMPGKDKVYVAVGYGITSTTMVVGDDGVIIIDPGENYKFAAEVMAEFRKITDKPIKAVVYTHRHPDHPFGIKGLGVTDEDVESGRVKIFAHDTFEEYLANDASVVGPILSMRTALASTLLPVGPEGRVHQALGPTFDVGPVSLIEPTGTFDEELEVEVAGVRMVLFHAYGDAEDEIAVWFPDLKHVHGSETIQGETFPNLYTLRGTKYRDPVEWYKGVDSDAESIVGFKFTDVGEDNALEIRKGVAVFHEEIPEGADATFVGTRDLLDRILLGETDVPKALASGELTIEGDQKAAEAFLTYFDQPSEEPIKLVVR